MDPREVISLAPPGLQPCRVQGNLWARTSLGSPSPSSQQRPWHELAHQRGQRLAPTAFPKLTNCPACTPKSPKLSPQPWFLSQRSLLMNLEYSRHSRKHPALGSHIYRLWGGRGRGKKGEAYLQISCHGCQPNICLFFMETQPSPWEPISSLSRLCSQGLFATPDPKTPTASRNYLVYRIFNILFQNCLQQSERREVEKQRI